MYHQQGQQYLAQHPPVSEQQYGGGAMYDRRQPERPQSSSTSNAQSNSHQQSYWQTTRSSANNVPYELDKRSYSYQSASSMGSRGSSVYSSSSGGIVDPVVVLEDTSFSPPPELPDDLKRMGKEARAVLPNFDRIKHSGYCLARLSLKAMVTKKWRQAFWITFGNHRVLFFRSKNDFEEWVSNPYLTTEGRDELVKMNIDFKDHLVFENMLGYKVSRTSSKSYRTSDGNIYQFKIDKWYNHGPSVNAAIGGKNEIDVRNIRKIMTAMMMLHPQNVKEDLEDYHQGVGTDTSAMNDSSGISIHGAHAGAPVYSSRQRPQSPSGKGTTYGNLEVKAKQRDLLDSEQAPMTMQQLTSKISVNGVTSHSRHPSVPMSPYQYDLSTPVQSHPQPRAQQQHFSAQEPRNLNPYQYDLGIPVHSPAHASARPSSAQYMDNSQMGTGGYSSSKREGRGFFGRKK